MTISIKTQLGRFYLNCFCFSSKNNNWIQGDKGRKIYSTLGKAGKRLDSWNACEVKGRGSRGLLKWISDFNNKKLLFSQVNHGKARNSRTTISMHWEQYQKVDTCIPCLKCEPNSERFLSKWGTLYFDLQPIFVVNFFFNLFRVKKNRSLK